MDQGAWCHDSPCTAGVPEQHNNTELRLAGVDMLEDMIERQFTVLNVSQSWAGAVSMVQVPAGFGVLEDSGSPPC